MASFGKSLTNAQFAEAREFERAKLCSISQAVKAFEKRDLAAIAAWRQALEALRAKAA